MKSYRLPAFLAAAFAIACGAASNVDVAAKAGGQQLSVTRLSDILGNSQAPLEKDVARKIAELWVNYQLAGVAAAKGDSVKDPKVVDAAMWSNLETIRVKKLYEAVSKTWDTSTNAAANEAQYARGDIMAARHILIQIPQGASPEQKAAAKKRADAIHAQVTAANFTKLAEKTEEPGGKERGGDLGVFGKGQMVPAFEKAVVSIKPGEISPVIETEFGFHIILRTPYADVKDQVTTALKGRSMVVAESTYLAKTEGSNDVKLTSNAAVTVKAAARNPLGYAKDNAAIATFKGGKLSVSRVADWIAAYPPQNQIRDQLQAAPDSMVEKFVHQLVRNELLLRQADSAKVAVDSTELANLRMAFGANLTGAWQQLGVDPTKLTDSAKTPAERETLAGKRIETYFDKLIKNEVPFVDIAYPIAKALQKSHDFSINDAGLDRAVEKAKSVRATADSVRSKQGPPTPTNPSPAPGGDAPPAPPTPKPAKP